MIKNLSWKLYEKPKAGLSKLLKSANEFTITIEIEPHLNMDTKIVFNRTSPKMPFSIGPIKCFDLGERILVALDVGSKKKSKLKIINYYEVMKISFWIDVEFGLFELSLDDEKIHDGSFSEINFANNILLGTGRPERDWNGIIHNLYMDITTDADSIYHIHIKEENVLDYFDKKEVQLYHPRFSSKDLLVSIITPSYNQNQFLSKSISSVHSQKYKNIEHLIYDPGSNDGSLATLNRLSKEHVNIETYIGIDQGHVDAINRGFKQFNGDIVAILNTDDFLYDETVVSTVVEAFNNNPDIKIIHAAGDYVDANGEFLRDCYINKDSAKLHEVMMSSVGVIHPTVFVRREVIEECGLYREDITYAFDYEYWLRLIFSGYKFHYIDQKFAKVTVHENAKTFANRAQSYEDIFKSVLLHYGFVSLEWLQRMAEFNLTDSDGIIDKKQKIKPDVLDTEIARLFRLYNHSNAHIGRIIEYGQAIGGKRTLRYVMDMVFKGTTVLVTSADSAFFSPLLTQISSLQSYEGSKYPALIYDLGLSEDEIGLLNSLENVYVVGFPKYLREFPDWYFDPKKYAYKTLAIAHTLKVLKKDTKLLWLDAGICINKSIEKIIAVIDKEGYFFVNHDDRPNWPFYNITCTTRKSLRGLKATAEEALGPHIRASAVGVKNNQEYIQVFEESFDYSFNKDIIVGASHPSEPIKKIPQSRSIRQTFWDKNNAQKTTDWDMDEYLDIFGYYGHRQDQSILSILATRYKLPIQSAKEFCVSSSISTQASKQNMASGGISEKLVVKHDLTGYDKDCILVQHRGTYRNYEGIQYKRQKSKAIILGNGPSLKGFDLQEDFSAYDTFGMNSAYRYWHEIAWYPDYYACLDDVVGMSHKEAILELITNAKSYGIKAFILKENLCTWLTDKVTLERVWNFDKLRSGVGLFRDGFYTTGSHSCAWAVWLGYEDISIIGVDCNYVELVDGAKLTDNSLLVIEKNTAENPNYFFEGYQQKGDVYNIPNPNKNLHINAWNTLAEKIKVSYPKVKIKNLSFISHLQCFDFEPYVRNEDKYLLGPFSRTDQVALDESAVIAHLFENHLNGELMIDVGAHFGTALAPFLGFNWDIYAYEPDPNNRVNLEDRMSRHENGHKVILSTKAIADKPATNVTFYTSEVSTGISGLSSFHESHKEAFQVDVETLTNELSNKNISAVDFLKIDTEGYDFFVLKGFPWDRFRPAVIECEYEDSKTIPLGYTYDVMATYLLEKGYKVYLSEWHPIIRYGISHQWHSLQKYPCKLSDVNSWGNLLAFRDDLDEVILRKSFRAMLKIKKPPNKFEGQILFRRIKPIGDVTFDEAQESYTLEPNHQRNKLYCVFTGAIKAGDKLIMTLSFELEFEAKLSISFGRAGKTEYEGTNIMKTYMAGANKVEMTCNFKREHSSASVVIGSCTQQATISNINMSIKNISKK